MVLRMRVSCSDRMSKMWLDVYDCGTRMFKLEDYINNLNYFCYYKQPA